MNYEQLLVDSYKMQVELGDESLSRLEYLAEYVFDFTTYDGDMSELFAAKALEVCSAISMGSTRDYIKDADNYRWYLLMINMPFFAGRLTWGISVRHAWWDGKQPSVSSCGLWCGEEQMQMLEFPQTELDARSWKEFVAALLAFPGAPEPS